MDMRFVTVYKSRLQRHIDEMHEQQRRDTRSMTSMDVTETDLQLNQQWYYDDTEQQQISSTLTLKLQVDFVTDEPKIFF
jgi:hypothetical protein